MELRSGLEANRLQGLIVPDLDRDAPDRRIVPAVALTVAKPGWLPDITSSRVGQQLADRVDEHLRFTRFAQEGLRLFGMVPWQYLL